ncbi:hypothetical protein MP638_006337 [Amoeboaphelidium occidentale]|nr:hypothetical protein MP638_006337 [Amoeboaphelidium occidentale]
MTHAYKLLLNDNSEYVLSEETFKKLPDTSMLCALLKDDQMLTTKNKDGVYELKLDYPAMFPYALKLGTDEAYTPTDLAMELVKGEHDLVKGFDQVWVTVDYLGFRISKEFVGLCDLLDTAAIYRNEVAGTRIVLEKEFCGLYFQLAKHLRTYASNAKNGDQYHQYFNRINIEGPFAVELVMSLHEITPTIEVCFAGIWPNIEPFKMEPLVKEFKHSKDVPSETLLEIAYSARPKLFISLFKKYIVPILAVPFQNLCMLEDYSVTIQHKFKDAPPPAQNNRAYRDPVPQSPVPKSKRPLKLVVTFSRLEKPQATSETPEITPNETIIETVDNKAESIGK